MVSNSLHGLSIGHLKRLIHGYTNGALKHYVSSASLRTCLPEISIQHETELLILQDKYNWNSSQVVYLLSCILDTKTSSTEIDDYLDLVLSGPKHSTIPTRDTLAVYNELVSSAKNEILMASYAIYNGMDMFKPLASKLDNSDTFKVSLYLDVPRKQNDTSVEEMILRRYKNDFEQKQWPGSKLPKLFYFKNSLHVDWKVV